MKTALILMLLVSSTAALAQTTAASVTIPPNRTPPAAIAATPAPIVTAPRPRALIHNRRVGPTVAELHVSAANRMATLEPMTSGYINAVQVYP
ncbi:MAG: P-type conjugative transfer protein TrbG, partial [Novosphingobium sp.]|nr:P-type conjugative transfer protein TrbG [Novosphingobium sp.]